MDIAAWTFENVQNFISNLGFPVFMCLYFMYSQRRAEARHDKIINELDCVQSQLLETKLQVGKVLPAAAETIAKQPQTNGQEVTK